MFDTKMAHPIKHPQHVFGRHAPWKYCITLTQEFSVQRRQPHIINNRYLLSRYSCPNEAPCLRPLLRRQFWPTATNVVAL